jgi:hypothetical protein
VADFDDRDHKVLVLNFVEDAVDALAHPIAFLDGEFFAPRGAWIVGQCLDALSECCNVKASMARGGSLPSCQVEVAILGAWLQGMFLISWPQICPKTRMELAIAAAIPPQPEPALPV